YIIVGGQKLCFESDTDLRLDDFSNLAALSANIKQNIQLIDANADETTDHIRGYLANGTVLSVGTSQATLNESVFIDIDTVVGSQFDESLNNIRSAATGEGMIRAVMEAVSQYLSLISGKNTTVTFEFDHKLGAPSYTWSSDYSTVTASAVCEYNPDHVVTETVETTMVTDQASTAVAGGKVTYTAEFNNSFFETQTKQVETEVKDYKFAVEVSSVDGDSRGSVLAAVYPDYSAEIVIEGTTVNTSNVKVGVYMKDVLSLGVEGVRSYERELNTGLDPQSVPLTWVSDIYAGFASGTVVGSVVGADGSVTYTIVKEGTNLKATPDSAENASTVWHAVVNENTIEAGVKETDDSYAVLKAGSYILVGDQRLDITSDLRIDNPSDLSSVLTAIRAAADMTPSGTTVEGVEIYLEPDSELALGTSTAKLIDDAKISIDIADYDEAAFAEVLDALRNAPTTGDLLRTGKAGLQTLAEAMNGKTTTVEFEFGHKWAEPEYEWSEDNSTVTATRICENNEKHTETETVETTYEDVDATCEEAGTRTFTAVFENEAFTTQTKNVEIKATGHDWGDPVYEWAEDNSSVTAKRVCKNDETHVETETVATTVVETPATALRSGARVYTATFTNEAFTTQTKTIEIDPVDYKFAVEVSSENTDGSTGSVTAVVYPDYSAEIAIEGTTVNTSNVKVGVWMKNVESLGVEGVRSYERSLETGLDPQAVPLTWVSDIYAGFTSGTVVGSVVGADGSVTYTIVKEGTNLKATPDSAENAST
ncbi:MAG: hypothetical protein IJH41_00530, partial [Eubacterium sp.]|nr:hypothetical protein [Eubacterium sp.]